MQATIPKGPPLAGGTLTTTDDHLAYKVPKRRHKRLAFDAGRDDRVNGRASFVTGKRRTPTNEAPESVIRKIWMIVELFRHKRLTFDHYAEKYERNKRSFQRDIQQLNLIGEDAGFKISAIKNDCVTVEISDPKLGSVHRAGKQGARLIGDVVRAMGQPIANEVGPLALEGDATEERFFHFATPKIIENEGSLIAQISKALLEAWKAKALVTFRYPDARKPGTSKLRTVEPYRVLLRSGTFYLVGYDRGARDWRTFALDRFATVPERAGSNNANRPIPPEHASDDVLGFIKSGGAPIDVTVELNARVAASATSRRWQSAQRVELLADGRARIVFHVSNIYEIVRWAFGFGEDATIVAPPEAVALATSMALTIAANHERYVTRT